jgi:hypothetical protein
MIEQRTGNHVRSYLVADLMTNFPSRQCPLNQVIQSLKSWPNNRLPLQVEKCRIGGNLTHQLGQYVPHSRSRAGTGHAFLKLDATACSLRPARRGPARRRSAREGQTRRSNMRFSFKPLCFRNLSGWWKLSCRPVNCFWLLLHHCLGSREHYLALVALV